MKSLYRPTAALILSSLLWFTALEGLARLWVKTRGDALDLAMALLRADSRLGWRQRSSWKGSLFGAHVATNDEGLRNGSLEDARKASLRILVLGPSSTFGWGVREEETYTRQLERFLRFKRPEPLSVVNGGEIGFSVWQGMELFKRELHPALRPDIVVVAYGANDPDMHRFFFDGNLPDEEALRGEFSRTAVLVQNLLRRACFIRVAARLALKTGDWISCGRGKSRTWRPNVRRVPLADFEADLDELIRQIHDGGGKAMLLTTPFRFPVSPEPSRSAAEKSQAEFKWGARSMGEGKPEYAVRHFQRAVSADPTSCDARHALAEALSAAEKCAESRAEAAMADRCEPGRLGRDLVRYNAVVRNVAAHRGAALVDAHQLLADHPEIEMLDAIHPTAHGHFRIAEKLETMVKGTWSARNRN